MVTEAQTNQGSGRKRALFVFVTVLIDSMGIGIIIPVMPDLLREVSGLGLAQAALWGGYLSFSYAAMQFLFSPVLGNLSDRFGRRPVLLISLLTLGLDYLMMAMAPVLWLLFVGRLVAGIAGATHATATAYIADVTPRDQRAAAFGLVGAGFGVGFVIGPVIGGLAGEIGTRAPFYVAAALAFANFVYGALVLPESLPPEKRRRFEFARANPLGALAQIRSMPMVAWFVAVIFLYNIAHFVYPAIWSFYCAAAFGWSAGEIGLSLAAVGIGFAFVQGFLMRRLIDRFGEARTAAIGLAANVVSLAGFGLAPAGWVVYLMIPVSALGAIVAPALNGLMSSRVPDDAQGELQGLLSSVAAVTAIFSPLLMTFIFSAFTSETAPVWLPGAPFLAGAVLMAVAVLPFVAGLKQSRA